MKNKKIFYLGTTILAALTLAACSNQSTSSGNITANAKDVAKTGFPIVKKNLKMTMFAPGSGTIDYSKMAVLKDYAKMTNISFKYTTPPSADVGTKLNLALASGDAQDVLFAAGITNTQAIQYGGSTLIPLEKYIKEGYMPNLKKILDKYPDIKKSITTPDGHIYTLPYLAAQYDVSDPTYANKPAIWSGSVWLNGPWMKKLGISMPKTTDDLYNMLMAFKTKDPNGDGKADEIPLSSTNGGYYALRDWIMNAFGVLNQEQQVDSNGKVTYGAIQKGYRDYLAYMNKLYAAGLLDKQVFSQSDDQKKAKGSNDLLGAYTDWFSYFTSNKNPEKAIEDPMALPLTSPDSSKPVITASDGITNGAFAVTDKCANPAAALRWVDYFYSSKGSQYLNVGPDEAAGGMWHWETNDSGKKVRVLNKGIDPTKTEDARSKVTPDYGTVPPKVQARGVDVLTSKNQKDTQDAFGKFIDQQAALIWPDRVVAWPTLYTSAKQQKEMGSTLETDLLTYVTQSEAKFITGQTKLTDANWDKYVKTLKGIGVDKYVKVQQEAYDTWKKAK